jgi:hypothetical protein
MERLMRVDEFKQIAKEMARLETSISEAQRTLDAFKTVAAYLAHRNGVKHKPVVEVKEPKLIEAPAKPPLTLSGTAVSKGIVVRSGTEQYNYYLAEAPLPPMAQRISGLQFRRVQLTRGDLLGDAA